MSAAEFDDDEDEEDEDDGRLVDVGTFDCVLVRDVDDEEEDEYPVDREGV